MRYVDDLGNEIITYDEYVDGCEDRDAYPKAGPKGASRLELIESLEYLLECDEKLPEHAKRAPVSQDDLARYARLILEVLKVS